MLTAAMEPTPKPTMLEQLDARISALDAAFAQACDAFETLRRGGRVGPALHPEDEGPIVP
jgi:hypothetical protein